jgi:hypothetical protein
VCRLKYVAFSDAEGKALAAPAAAAAPAFRFIIARGAIFLLEEFIILYEHKLITAPHRNRPR